MKRNIERIHFTLPLISMLLLVSFLLFSDMGILRKSDRNYI